MPSFDPTMTDDRPILKAQARRSDQVAVQRLTEPLPTAIREQLTNRLQEDASGFSGMRYEAETRRAFWIAADAATVLVLTITDVADQNAAASIWAAIADQGVQTDPDKIIAMLGAENITRN